MAEAHRTLVENLRYAADRLEKRACRWSSSRSTATTCPATFVTHSGRALDIIDETGASNLKLQYDIYHMQRMEGELTATIEKNLALSSARALGVSLPNTATAQELFNSCVRSRGLDGAAATRAGIEMPSD